MKKHLIAAAVAGVIAAPAMAAVTLDGTMDIAIRNDKTTGSTATTTIANSTGNNGTTSISVRSNEDLGGGMSASMRYEIGVDNTDAGSATRMYEGYVALGGGFGTIKLGTPNSNELRVLASGTFGTKIGGNWGESGGAVRNAETIKYDSPNMGGVTISVATSPKDGQTGTNGGTKAKNEVAAYASMGPVSFGVVQAKQSGVAARNSLNAKASVGGATLNAIYTDADDKSAANADYKTTAFSVAYPMGAATLQASFTTMDPSGSTTKTKVVGIGANYSLSKMTRLYVRYVKDDNGAAADTKTTLLGLTHSF
jgi:predicted porin